MDGMLPPGSTDFAGSMTYHLGTDQQGRDMLSAIIFGLRMTLGVGVMSTFIAQSLGMSIGVLAAYFGGKVDTVIIRVVDLQLSFPSILVALILLAALGQGGDKVVLALIILKEAYLSPTVHGSAL